MQGSVHCQQVILHKIPLYHSGIPLTKHMVIKITVKIVNYKFPPKVLVAFPEGRNFDFLHQNCSRNHCVHYGQILPRAPCHIQLLKI
jgi:hypothetical protein